MTIKNEIKKRNSNTNKTDCGAKAISHLPRNKLNQPELLLKKMKLNHRNVDCDPSTSLYAIRERVIRGWLNLIDIFNDIHINFDANT